MNTAGQSWTTTSVTYGDDADPSLGVREPRRPLPSTGSSGAALQPPHDHYAEARALAEGPRVVVTPPIRPGD